MQKIIALNCSPIDNVRYAFASEDYVVGEKLVIDIAGVVCIGSVLAGGKQIDQNDLTEELGTIERRATQLDLEQQQANDAKAQEAVKITKQKVKQLKLKMKVVGAYYSLDASKVVIDFTAEDRVDFRDLLKELASSLHTRIELRQIGQRDEVKIKGGLGPCGEICCCKRFLNDFGHVSVKMAKTQGLSLSPTKISGLCGRLMCCLAYENPTYEEVLKRMPKVGSSIKTPNGEGTVVYNDLLREMVSVRFGSKDETSSIEAFSLEELANPELARKQREEKLSKAISVAGSAESNNAAPSANRQTSVQKLGEVKPADNADASANAGQNTTSKTEHNDKRNNKQNHKHKNKQNNNQPKYGLEIVELGADNSGNKNNNAQNAAKAGQTFNVQGENASDQQSAKPNKNHNKKWRYHHKNKGGANKNGNAGSATNAN